MNASDTKSKFYDLTALSLVRVSGEDTDDFLQGQLSNDIAQLNSTHPHQMSAYCTPKGRVLALFHILKQEEGYLLIAPGEVMKKVLPRLRMYVMRAKVVFTPEEKLKLYGMQSKPDPDSTADHENFSAMQRYQHCLDTHRFFMLADHPPVTQLRSGNEWEQLDIEQNLPQLHLPLYETLIPQSLNLDLIGAINFRKGCYPGQEIIARVKYRGKPKTRMIRARYCGNEALEPGDAVYIDGKERSAGQIVNTATDHDVQMLSVAVPVTHLDEGVIYLDEARTISLERLPSPYVISA